MITSTARAQPTPNIPTRHGADMAQSRRVAKPLLMFIRDREAAEPTITEWSSMGQALNEGDPQADALVAWMREANPAAARGMFERALAQGIAAVPEAPAPLRDFFKHVERAPAWLDWARLERGLSVSHRTGVTGMRVLRDLGLMAGYQAGAINKTLLATGALEKGAARRIAETTKWWMDCMTPGGLARNGDGFKTTVRVRMIHAMVRRMVAAKPDWDVGFLGLPVNQLDMQGTYLGFSALYLLGQRVMGVILTQQEADDVMHLWRYIGWLMGVQEEWLCADEASGRVALYRNVLSQAPADESSQLLGRALADEPLERHYERFTTLRRHWDKAVHLSIVRLFVGQQGMKALGLPTWVLPWYPLAFAPLNAAWCLTHRVVPGGMARLEQRGWLNQQAQMKVMFGHAKPDIRPMGGGHSPGVQT